MKINEFTTPVWQELAICNSCVSKIIFPDELNNTLRLDSIAPTEWSSYLYGVLDRDTLYVTSREFLCVGKSKRINGPEVRSVGLHPERHHSWVFAEEVVRLFAQKVNNVGTILSHNHPRTTAEDLRSIAPKIADSILSSFQQDIGDGIFDYLIEQGVNVNLDEVVNESISRALSDEDIAETFGVLHLLITDTARSGRVTSHLNAYKIDKKDRAVSKIATGLLSNEPKSRQIWFSKVVEQFWVAFGEASKRHEKITESFPEEIQFMPSKFPRNAFFIEA